MKNAQHLMNDLGFLNDRLYSLNNRLHALMLPFCGVPAPQPRPVSGAEGGNLNSISFLAEMGNRLQEASNAVDEANELLNWLADALGQGEKSDVVTSGTKAFR